MGFEGTPKPKEEEQRPPEPGAVVERPQQAVIRKMEEHEKQENHLRAVVNGIDIRVSPNLEDTWELYLPGVKDAANQTLPIGFERDEGIRAFEKAKEIAASATSPEELMKRMEKFVAEQIG